MKFDPQSKPIEILLADDDTDDRFFFSKALQTLPIPTHLEVVMDGIKLMEYLHKNAERLPDVLFLDINMPRKNGSECLIEIKEDEKLKELPVVMYSTSLHTDIADLLYKWGAHFYVQKTDFKELKKILLHILTLMAEKKFARPSRAEFVVHMVEV